MSVQLRGKKYHYHFRLKEHRFSGVCENCTTKKDALKFEEQVYAEKLKECKRSGMTTVTEEEVNKLIQEVKNHNENTIG